MLINVVMVPLSTHVKTTLWIDYQLTEMFEKNRWNKSVPLLSLFFEPGGYAKISTFSLYVVYNVL